MIKLKKYFFLFEFFFKNYIFKKGTVLIGVFGLPYASVETPGNEMKAALKIYENLHIAKINTFIGIATGKVFAGDVGSSSRREYAVLQFKIFFFFKILKIFKF